MRVEVCQIERGNKYCTHQSHEARCPQGKAQAWVEDRRPADGPPQSDRCAASDAVILYSAT